MNYGNKKAPRRNPNSAFWKSLFFAEFYEESGYLPEIYCNVCGKWAAYFFEEHVANNYGLNVHGLRVACAGCAKDLTVPFSFQGEETLQRIKEEKRVRWITLEEKNTQGVYDKDR